MLKYKCNHYNTAIKGLQYTLNYTGEDINNAIAKMLDLNLGEFNGYMFAGVAYPNTVPMELTYYDIFYLATDPGIYTSFDNAELDGTRVAIFKSTSEGTWDLEILNIPLDVREVAENAKAIADLALSNTSKVKEDVEVAKNTASSALGSATDALALAAIASGLANACIKTSERGIPNGVPVLDENGKVPLSLLPLTKTELVDSYESDSIEMAPTADALRRAYMHHKDDMDIIADKLEAILDLVGDTTEMGISPTNITVTSVAQSVKCQIVCNGEWHITEVPEQITVTPMTGTGTSLFIVKFKNNESLVDDIVGKFKVGNSFGKEKLVNFTQYSASVKYEYELTVTPNPVALPSLSGNGMISVVSIKTPYINSVPSGESEDVPFVVSSVAADTWFKLDVNQATKYTYTENILEASRSTTITVKQPETGGKTIAVPVNLNKATINTKFEFLVTPANAVINDNGAGGTYPIKITSTKTTTVNDRVTTVDAPYFVSYTGGASNLWIVYDELKHTVTLPLNNEETSRSGELIFTQESPTSSTIVVPITQAQAVVDWKYIFNYSPLEMQFGNSAGSKQYTVTESTKQKTINGTLVGEKVYVDWGVSLTGDTAFTLNEELSTVSAIENKGTDRAATLTFNRPELGESGNNIIAIKQSAGIVTYEYTLQASANPTSIAAVNGTTVLTVVSTKQKYLNGITDGDPILVNWHGTSTNGFISGADLSGSTWTMTENKTESTRTDIITIAQLENDSKTTTVNLTQLAGTVTYDYVFTVNPTSLSYATAGGSQSITILSTKQKKINGINTEAPVHVSYGSSTLAGTGFAVSGTSITATQNNNEGTRSGSVKFTQAETQTEKVVTLSQAAGVVTWLYSFTGSPGSLSYSYAAGSLNVSISSSKQKYINGAASGGAISVGYSNNAPGNGFSISGTSIAAAVNNTLAAKSATAVFTQGESSKSISVSLSQAAGVEGWNYYLTVSPAGSFRFLATGETKTVTVDSYRMLTINGLQTGVRQEADYITIPTGAGLTASKNTMTYSQNNTVSIRRGQVSFSLIAGGGTHKNVDVELSGGTVEDLPRIVTYPPELIFLPDGYTTETATVQGYILHSINGNVIDTTPILILSLSADGDDNLFEIHTLDSVLGTLTVTARNARVNDSGRTYRYSIEYYLPDYPSVTERLYFVQPSS